jgi:hypothetical protein
MRPSGFTGDEHRFKLQLKTVLMMVLARVCICHSCIQEPYKEWNLLCFFTAAVD